jgi:hypothetical protein
MVESYSLPFSLFTGVAARRDPVLAVGPLALELVGLAGSFLVVLVISAILSVQRWAAP